MKVFLTLLFSVVSVVAVAGEAPVAPVEAMGGQEALDSPEQEMSHVGPMVTSVISP